MSEIVSQTNGKILHHILPAIHNEDAVLDVEEFPHKPRDRGRDLESLAMPSFQFLFKQEDEFILHPQLGVIEQDGDIRNQIFNPGKERGHLFQLNSPRRRGFDLHESEPSIPAGHHVVVASGRCFLNRHTIDGRRREFPSEHF